MFVIDRVVRHKAKELVDIEARPHAAQKLSTVSSGVGMIGLLADGQRDSAARYPAPGLRHDLEMDDAVDDLAITRLQASYGDAVTRQAWDELIPMFLPDCPVRLDLRGDTVIEKIGPEEIGR